MASWLVERRLTGIGQRLRALREELRILDEQAMFLTDDADETELRAIVSDSPLDARDAREAARHALAARTRRVEIVDRIAQLEHRQDELLDRLSRRAKGRRP
jgi:hypothetical protein